MIIDPTGERINKDGPCACGSRNLSYQHGCGGSNHTYEHATKTPYDCFCRCEDCRRAYIARNFEYGHVDDRTKPDYWEGIIVVNIIEPY